MKTLIYLALFCFYSSATVFEAGPQPTTKDRHAGEEKHFPNILMIVVDDLRPALGAYGDKLACTPNINKLAEAGVVFKNAFAQQALCGPSRTSFLTSRRPGTLKIYDSHRYWRNQSGNFTTLPQYFKENKYYTKNIGKVFHPGASSNFSDDYPLSWSENPYHPPSEYFERRSVCPDKETGGVAQNLLCQVDINEQPYHTLPDIENQEEAIRILDERSGNKGEPFFLAVGFLKPHIPFRTPQDYFDYYPVKNITLPLSRVYLPTLPTVAWNPWTDIRRREDVEKLNIPFPFGPMPDDFAKKIIQAYYASVTYIDDMIGKVLHNLEERELHDKTIVVLLSDHGWSLAEHGEWAKYSNFEVALKVPLIFRIPDMTYFPNNPEKNKAVEVDNLVELVDLFPTLVELAGLEKLKPCPKQSKNTTLCTDGKSLAPLIRQKVYKNETVVWEDKVFSQYPRPSVAPEENSDQPSMKDIRFMGYTVRTKRYRYTEWVPLNPVNQEPIWEAKVGGEWYDHLDDPEENVNMFLRQDQPARAMKKKLRKALKKKFK